MSGDFEEDQQEMFQDEAMVVLVRVRTVCPRCGRAGRPLLVEQQMTVRTMRKYCHHCEIAVAELSIYL